MHSQMNYIIEYITIVVRLLVLVFIIIMQILSILIPATTRCTDFSYYSILENEDAWYGMEYTSFDDDYYNRGRHPQPRVASSTGMFVAMGPQQASTCRREGWIVW